MLDPCISPTAKANGFLQVENLVVECGMRQDICEWVESRRESSSLRGNAFKVDSRVNRGIFGLEYVSTNAVHLQQQGDRAVMDLETRRSILKRSYAKREAELKDLYLSEVRELDRIESLELGFDACASRTEQKRELLQSKFIDFISALDLRTAPHLSFFLMTKYYFYVNYRVDGDSKGAAEVPKSSHAPTVSRMFHTKLRSPIRSEVCPERGVEDDAMSLSRKPKRRFTISRHDRLPTSSRADLDLDDVAGQAQGILSMQGSQKRKENLSKKDVYSFEDSQSDIFVSGKNKSDGIPESTILVGSGLDLLVAGMERSDDIVDTDEDEVVNGCITSNNKDLSTDESCPQEDATTAHVPTCTSTAEPHLAKKRLQKGRKGCPPDLSPTQRVDLPCPCSTNAARDTVQAERFLESVEEHQMLDVTEAPVTNDCDWVSRVMTIPWKVLYIEHLSKEGWTWNYISGLEPICYYVPGFGPLDDSKRKDMTEQQILEYEQRVPVLDVSKFTSEDNIRRFIRRTRHADYEPSDMSQREEAERIADFGSEWNLAKNRKRRKSNPSFHYNPEDYYRNTCDISQGVHDCRDQIAEGIGKSKKKKSDDDSIKLDKAKRRNDSLNGHSPEYAGRDKNRNRDSTDLKNLSVKPKPLSDYDEEDHRPVVDVIRDRRARIELPKSSSADSSDRCNSDPSRATSMTLNNNGSSSTYGHEDFQKSMTSYPKKSKEGLLKCGNNQRGEERIGGMGGTRESAYKRIHQLMQGGDSEREDQDCDWSPDSHEVRRSPRVQGNHEAETQPQDFPSLIDTPEERRSSMKENCRGTANIRNRGRSVASSSAISSPPKPHNTFTNNISAEMRKKKDFAPSSSYLSQTYTQGSAKSTTVSSKGKSSGSQHCATTLFRGMTFILSGNNDDDKDAVTTRIQRHGGTVISQLPFLAAMVDHLSKAQDALEQGSSPPFFDQNLKVGLLSQHIILLSRPTNFRKSNFLLVLATGGTLLHHLWATRSMDKGALLPKQEYALPSGASALWPFYVFNTTRPPPVFGVLACLKVLNFAGKQWSPLLATCGVQVTPHNEMLLRAFGPSKIIDRNLYNIDIVVVDCLSYSEAVTRRHVEKIRGVRKKSKESGGLTTLELAAIEGCMEREGQLSVCEGGIKVVTIDWIVHCLQLGDQVPFDSNDIFALPLDPVNRPLGHKNDATKGNGERFMKYDVCYYRRANEDKEQLGQIRGFSRKSPSAPMQVRVRPLHLSGGYKGQSSMM